MWMGTRSVFWGEPEPEGVPEVEPLFEPLFEPWPESWTELWVVSRWVRFRVWLGDKIVRFGHRVGGGPQGESE